MTTGRIRSLVARSALTGAGAVAAAVALRAVASSAAGPRLERTNFRGRTVTLAAGPALAIAASATAAVGAGSGARAGAALVAGLGAGAVGCYDDVVGSRAGESAKGFRGHLGALRSGRLTSGMVKIAGVGLSGLAAAALLAADDRRPVGRRPGGRRARVADLLCGAGVIAGTANLVNLLDLRPGRALKAGLLLAAPLTGDACASLIAGPVGAASALLPGDLDERTMIGDTGANAYGALLGVALAARTGPLGRAALLAAIAGLTATSERVSFTRVIEATPVLRAVDTWGRRG